MNAFIYFYFFVVALNFFRRNFCAASHGHLSLVPTTAIEEEVVSVGLKRRCGFQDYAGLWGRGLARRTSMKICSRLESKGECDER